MRTKSKAKKAALLLFSVAVLLAGGAAVVRGLSVTTGTGSATFSVAGAVVTVNLTGVTNAQTITVSLDASDDVNTGNVVIPMRMLLGDTNGDRFVNAGDALQTRNRSGQTPDATNFRSDLNTDGLVNSGDAFIVRAHSGGFVP
jgi:hypothetical protein